MPDIKGKLVELISKTPVKTGFANSTFGKSFRPILVGGPCQLSYRHGVTIQEHDGCAYCKEDRDGYRGAFGAFSLSNPFHGDTWYIETGHCKARQIYFCPMCGRKLSEPPKGEQ